MNTGDNLWGPAFGLIASILIGKIFFSEAGILIYSAIAGGGLLGGFLIQQLIQEKMGKK